MDLEYNAGTSSVISTNSWAILQLMEGDQTEAVELLHLALDESRSRLEEIPTELWHSHGNVQLTTDAHIHSISLEGVIGNRENAVPDNYFRMYRCVYSIEGPDCESDVLVPEVTVVLVYNLAAVYHEMGFLTANNDLIEKALHLYEMARMILTKAHGVKQQILAMNLAELQLAVLNNLGHIYAYFMKYELMCLQRDALRLLVQEIDPRGVEPQVFQFFAQNVLLSLEQDYLLPAPAA